MVAVPMRAVVAVLAATDRATVPLPLPLAPLVTVSHEAVLAAVHAQPVGLVTVTLTDSPVATAVRVCGAMVFVHAPAAGCEMVKV